MKTMSARMLLSAASLALLALACRDIVAPVRTEGTNGSPALVNPAGVVIVFPDSMRGWVFYNDQVGAVCADASACRLVNGPNGQPTGSGSAELADSLVTDGKALILPSYAGTRFDQLTTLRYSTFRQSVDAGNNLAIALQFNVDFDLTDGSTGYQGRLVYEPYQSAAGNVPQNTWQSWDAKGGKWWGTRTTVTVSGATVTNSCVQSTPCTWSQLLTAFPDLGVHGTYGAVVLKAGSGWPGFRGNIDSLVIGVAGSNTIFDFELNAPPTITSAPPDSYPSEYASLSDTVRVASEYTMPFLRQIVLVEFAGGTPIPERQSAIASVNGVVAGGFPDEGPTGGVYSVRVTSDSTGAGVLSAVTRLKSFSSVVDAAVDLVVIEPQAYRRPNFGAGQRPADWTLNPSSAFGTLNRSWALNAINAPNAWGCSTGDDTLTRVGVLDGGFQVTAHLAPNVSHTLALVPSGFEHGSRMALTMAGRGDTSRMTGVMWRARLDLADMSLAYGDTIFATASAIIASRARHLAFHGNRVINASLSFGNRTQTSGPPTNAQNNTRARWGRIFRIASSLAPNGVRPLWVLAAGNRGAASSTYWNSLTGAADSLNNETIIVTGASWQAGALWQSGTPSDGAASNGLIHIAAPGQDVPTIGANGTLIYRDGTSFSAAFVTGIAGLLFSFDPTITASQAKTLLIQGAEDGGRVATGSGGTYPLADAYASLKRAARRNGAPLCGNRIWSNAANEVFAQRDPAGSAEHLLTVNTDPFDDTFVNVHHGGRRMEFAFNSRFVLGISGWVPGNWQDDDISNYSGAFKGSGAYFQDHDDKFSTQVTGAWSGGSFSLSVALNALGEGFTSRTVTTSSMSLPLMLDTAHICAREDDSNPETPTECTEHVAEGIREFPSQWDGALSGPGYTVFNALHALDPQGRFIIVPLSVRRSSLQVNRTWGPCWDAPALYPTQRCREGQMQEQSMRSILVRISLADGAATVLSTPSFVTTGVGDEVTWLSIDEQGKEVAIQIGGVTINQQGVGCTRGRHEWLTLPTSGVSTPVAHTVSIPGIAICNGEGDGSGASSLRAKP